MKLQQLWYRKNPCVWILSPLALLFRLLSGCRRLLYSCKLLPRFRAPVPVIVVGNLTVGGNGKTPVVIWLIETLRAAGYRPGVVSRGYGGKAGSYPLRLTPQTPASACGDEPRLIADRCGCPVVVAPKRADAVRMLLADGNVDVVISDDGLQHYALARDLEIVVVDGNRRYGNGHLLPMGPLREGLWRLSHTDAVVCNGGLPDVGEYPMQLLPEALRPLNPDSRAPRPNGEVDAIAGIGNPSRFFRTLEQSGFILRQSVEFDDHQVYTPEQLTGQFAEHPLLMTEKDAVKCRDFALDNWWYLPVSAVLPDTLRDLVLNKLRDKHYGSRS